MRGNSVGRPEYAPCERTDEGCGDISGWRSPAEPRCSHRVGCHDASAGIMRGICSGARCMGGEIGGQNKLRATVDCSLLWRRERSQRDLSGRRAIASMTECARRRPLFKLVCSDMYEMHARARIPGSFSSGNSMQACTKCTGPLQGPCVRAGIHAPASSSGDVGAVSGGNFKIS